jgi:hypothetical protein
MGKVYQFTPRKIQSSEIESEGVKQIRRNMAAWGRRQKRIKEIQDENNSQAKSECKIKPKK